MASAWLVRERGQLASFRERKEFADVYAHWAVTRVVIQCFFVPLCCCPCYCGACLHVMGTCQVQYQPEETTCTYGCIEPIKSCHGWANEPHPEDHVWIKNATMDELVAVKAVLAEWVALATSHPVTTDANALAFFKLVYRIRVICENIPSHAAADATIALQDLTRSSPFNIKDIRRCCELALKC